MKRKAVSILLTAAMVVGMTACGSAVPKSEGQDKADAPVSEAESADTETTESDTESTDTEAAESNIDLSEHVVINFVTTGDKPANTATDDMLVELNKILTEKVNAEVQMYYIEWTDYLTNYNLTLAQMDGSVDLVGTASDWLDAWQNAQNGAFLELSEDMLKTYAPRTWESVSPEHWEMCKYDGEIYLMPEDNFAQWVNDGFSYRIDWAKEAGLEDGVHSWEDLTEYFRYVKEAYPDIIPWNPDGSTGKAEGMVEGWVQSHSKFMAIEGICAGNIWGGMQGDPYTVAAPGYSDTEMLVEYAELMKEWDNIGVWKTDVLNNTAADNTADYRIGRTAVDQWNTNTWTDLCSHTPNNAIYAEDEDAETGFFYFGEETQNLVSLSITHGATAVSAASKNPERALMVYDLIRNDPACYRLMNYGVEGRQYEINEDGLRVFPASYEKDKDELLTNYWWGRNDDIEIRNADYNWDAIDALYAEYDKIKVDYPYGQFIPYLDDIRAKVDNINEIHGNYMQLISFGKYQGTAEEIVAEYQEAMEKAGFEEVTAELQRQIDELYK